MNRPDFSNFLAHFTTSRYPTAKNDPTNPTARFKYLKANKRLENILTERKILASSLAWTGGKAVCLTECPWASLVNHTERYSPFGIGFSKEFIFKQKGNPVFYVRPEYFYEQEWNPEIKIFTTPFNPSYRDREACRNLRFDTLCDYTHEREWRVPQDLLFEYSDVEFVVLKDYNAMASFPKELKDAIGREKFLLMDNYITVERLWPIHKY